MDHISLLLPKVLRKRGIKDQADASLIVYTATQWLEGKLPGVRPTKFTTGTLFIEAATSIAAQECYALTQDLLAALQSNFPSITIDRVRILRERTVDPPSLRKAELRRASN